MYLQSRIAFILVSAETVITFLLGRKGILTHMDSKKLQINLVKLLYLYRIKYYFFSRHFPEFGVQDDFTVNYCKYCQTCL